MQQVVVSQPMTTRLGNQVRPQIQAGAGRLNYGRLLFGLILVSGVIGSLNWVSWAYELAERRVWSSILVLLCLWPVVFQLAGRMKGIEILPVIAGFYFLHYAFPSFLYNDSIRPADEAATLYGLQLSCVGVLAMIIGDLLARHITNEWKIAFPRLDSRRTVVAATILLVVSTLITVLNVYFGTAYSLGGSFRQVIYIVFLPPFPLALLLLWDAQFGLEKRWRMVMLGCMALLLGSGALSGSLSAMMRPLLVYVLARWAGSGIIPVRLIFMLFCMYFVLQPAKQAYREVVWYSDYQGGVVESLGVFTDSVLNIWGEQIGFDLESKSTQFALQRLDCTSLMAQVVRLTPDTVPYQQGQTYSYFLYGLIPRFIWPDKPIARGANDWFALAYGFSLEEQIGQAVVGMPQLIEGFINFGVAGLLGAGLVFGLIYGGLSGLFTMPKTGIGGSAILIAVLIGLINIETSTSQLFSGILQQTLVYVLLLRFIRVK